MIKLRTVFTVIMYICIIDAYAIVLNALMIGSIFSLKYHVLEFSLFWTLLSVIVFAVILIIVYYLNDAEGTISDFTAEIVKFLTITAFALTMISILFWIYQLVFNLHTPLM